MYARALRLLILLRAALALSILDLVDIGAKKVGFLFGHPLRHVLLKQFGKDLAAVMQSR